MKNIFKQMITDFHQSVIPVPRWRELDFPQLSSNLRKVYVLVGMRRSGKTWALYQRMQDLLKSGLRQEQILYINFADDRLSDVKSQDFQLLLDAYFEIYPKHIDGVDLHFFFDEIHEVSGWEKFVRRLLDTEKMALYVSGSSAKMLSKEIATSLRGRAIVREIFPFGFQEYLHCHDLKITDFDKVTTKQKAVISYNLHNFLRYGGFPETLSVSDALWRELLQGYIDSVIYRDIIERYQITNGQAVKKLLIQCLQNSASLFSINKTYNYFKSQGYVVSKNSLYDFMEYFEDAYCVFSVPLYNFSVKKSELRPKKIYPVDQGLVTAYTVKDLCEEAARQETAVFSFLRRKNKEVYYYQTGTGKEVDFLTLSPEKQIAIYQVTVSLKAEKTRAREVSALQEAMCELNLQSSIIITLDEELDIDVPEGKIQCLPLWKALLLMVL
jgi:uncharacterized protein